MISLLPVHLKITRKQYLTIFKILNSISATYGSSRAPTEASSPSLQSPTSRVLSNRTTFEYIVDVPSIHLEIFAFQAELGEQSLATFLISEGFVKSATLLDGASNMEISIKSLSVLDSRAYSENLYKDILKKTDSEQRMLVIHSYRPDIASASTFTVTIDSPKFNLILDHIFAVADFFSSETAQEPLTVDDGQTSPYEDVEAPPNSKFRVNIVDLEIMILQNCTSSSTEAIILTSKQLTIARDVIFTFSSLELGMFFCQVDQRSETTLRFIQNFDISLTLDDANSTPGHKNSIINIDLTPLMLRVSYKDLLLLLDIANQFGNLSKPTQVHEPVEDTASVVTTSNSDQAIMSRERVSRFVTLAPSFNTGCSSNFNR